MLRSATDRSLHTRYDRSSRRCDAPSPLIGRSHSSIQLTVNRLRSNAPSSNHGATTGTRSMTSGTSGGSTSGAGAERSASVGSVPPNAKVKALSFQNAHGERLAATFVDTGSPDVAIFCHGYAATKDGFHFPNLAAELAAQGKSSLRFDFAGNGESEGSFSFGNYYREVGDLRAAVEFIRRDLQRSVSAVVGHSKGGNVVLLYASRYDDVPHVVNVAGRGLMSRGIKERFGADILERLATHGSIEQEVRVDGGRRIKYPLTRESVEERLAMDMFAEVAKIRKAHVLTLHGSADTVIPVEDAHSLADHIASSPHTLLVVEGADHNFRQPEKGQEVVRLIVEHLARTTRGAEDR